MEDTKAILKELYPLLKKNITSSTISGFKKLMSKFIESRYQDLYDTAPCGRIIFTTEDADQLFKLLKISRHDVQKAIEHTYYYKIKKFNPRAAKDEFTVLALCLVRYFLLEKKDKELELSIIYLSFSGKFYPSVHSGSYPDFPPSEYRHIMEFVINKKLNYQYDLKREGTVIKAVKSVATTWIETYTDRFKSFDDEDVAYIIQQLHDRIKTFTINIAKVYYEAYDKNEYMTYDSDDLSDENYRLADSNSLRAERYIEASMSNIISKGVDQKYCKIAANENVKTQEIRSILETIIMDNKNIPVIKELIRILIIEYMDNSEDQNPANPMFIIQSVKAKPNTKNPNILRQNEILNLWLDENSPSYRKRKSRLATKLAYHKSVLMYFALIIQNSCK